LELIAAIAGQVSVVDAADRLGISEAMFYKLRTRVLQLSLADLEPKPIGRPAQRPSEEAAQSAELAQRVAELERELSAQAVRLELAQTMPHVLQDAGDAPKKTTRQERRKEKLRQSRARRRRKPSR
jgi:hypothetical protein